MQLSIWRDSSVNDNTTKQQGSQQVCDVASYQQKRNKRQVERSKHPVTGSSQQKQTALG